MRVPKIPKMTYLTKVAVFYHFYKRRSEATPKPWPRPGYQALSILLAHKQVNKVLLIVITLSARAGF